MEQIKIIVFLRKYILLNLYNIKTKKGRTKQ